MNPSIETPGRYYYLNDLHLQYHPYETHTCDHQIEFIEPPTNLLTKSINVFNKTNINPIEDSVKESYTVFNKDSNGDSNGDSYKSDAGTYVTESIVSDADQLYKDLLRTYSTSINYYLNTSPKYSHWKEYWSRLDNNLSKTNLTIDRLDSNNKDVAYTYNKGDVIRFRWRDKSNWIPRSVYTYVLVHELCHQVFPSTFIGHGHPFPEMLCIMVVAAYELRLFDLSQVPNHTVYSNGTEITSRQSLKKELLTGIKMLRMVNHDSKTYYDQLTKKILSD